MKKIALICIVVGMVIFPIYYGFSQEDNPADETWERVGVRAGVFLALLNNSLRFGFVEGTGRYVDLEDTLGLSSSVTVFKADAYWRFSHNRRHRFDFGYAAYNRSANRVIQEDIQIGGEIITAGTTVDTVYNVDIIKLLYSWSFLHDDRIDLGIGGGFYVMPVEIKIKGEYSEAKTQDITAPLPVFDFRMDFLVTPKTYFRLRLDLFYIAIGDFKGSIADYGLDYEWKFSKHVGVGVGLESFVMRIEGQGDGSGLYQPNGKIQTEYIGLMVYGKLYF